MAWYDGMDAATVGHIQNRGYDKLEGDALAKSLYEWGRNAESKLGMPHDRILRLPDKPDDAAGWNAVHTALGRPEKPDAYTAPDVKLGGEALKPEFLGFLQGLAHKTNMPASQFQTFAADIVKHLEEQGAASAAATREAATKAAAEKAAADVTARSANNGVLQNKWGVQFDANHSAAVTTAKALGYSDDEIAEMATTQKYGPFMERMLALHKATGEAPGLGIGGNNGGTEVRETEEQLEARRQELLTKARGRMLSGEEGEAVFREMAEISRKLVVARHTRR